MIIDVLQAGTEPAAWWTSATAPWWATPVSTVAGALLAWMLARSTNKRAEIIAARRESQRLRRQTYVDFWAAIVDHHGALIFEKPEQRQQAFNRASHQLLSLEISATPEVLAAANRVIETLKDDATNEQRGIAAAAYRAAVSADLRSM